MEQFLPALAEKDKQVLLMFQDSIQTPVEPVLGGHREIDPEQIRHGRLIEPVPMKPELAARINEPVYDK